MNVLVVETNELGKFTVEAQEWWWPEVYVSKGNWATARTHFG
jgi:hypothetical protein